MLTDVNLSLDDGSFHHLRTSLDLLNCMAFNGQNRLGLQIVKATSGERDRQRPRQGESGNGVVKPRVF